MKIVIRCSDIVSALSESTIGAKVLDRAAFWPLVHNAISLHDFDACEPKGQAVINLAHGILSPNIVSGGVGRKTPNPYDYVLRPYRGQVHMFLKREHAAPWTSLRAVVYTREGYLRDPDVVGTPEYDRFASYRDTECTHVLVAVLASAVDSFVSPYRFVANLAGGNLAYQPGYTSHADLVALASKVKAFDDEWAVVAD